MWRWTRPCCRMGDRGEPPKWCPCRRDVKKSSAKRVLDERDDDGTGSAKGEG